MTKLSFINGISEKLGFPKKEAGGQVEMIFETLKSTLAKGEKIKISGFGIFFVRDKCERLGRNPQTGEPMTILARRVLTFKPSLVLKEEMNKGRT